MTGSPPASPWYLARDGQQFGPLSDAELAKFVDGGHLKPTDLVWREGFPDWRSARFLMPSGQSGPAHPLPETRPVEPAPAPIQPPRREAPASRPQSHEPRPEPHEPQRSSARSQPSQRPSRPTGDPGMDLQLQPGQMRQQDPQAVAPPADHAPEAAPRPQSRSRRREPAPARDEGANVETEPRRRGGVGRLLRRIAAILFFIVTLAAAGWYAYPYRERILSMASAVTSFGGSSVDQALLSVSPLKGFQPTPEATDEAFQKTLLWRTLKRDFPEWYLERTTEAAEGARGQRDDVEIGQKMARGMMLLRRQHASDALSATMPRLKNIASAFAQSLQRLRAHSVDACYGFISAGEAHPIVVGLFQTPEHAGYLQKQLNAVFEAVAEGRKTPRVYPAPKQADYNLLVTELEARGWTQEDMQTFSDSKALAKTPPEKICKLVQEWFEAQLAVKDPDAQLRLIVDALRPVVAG